MADEATIQDVLKVLEVYTNASNVKREQYQDGFQEITFDLKVRKPPMGYANDVRPIEPVRLLLAPGFPLIAPFIRLRADFSRALPHINPMSRLPTPGKDLVEPCVVDESIDTYFHFNGFPKLLHRLQTWLDDAAFDSLAKDDRFWEPIRRDGLSSFLTASRDKMAKLITDRKGHAYLPSLMFKGEEAVDELDFCGYVTSYTGMSPEELVSKSEKYFDRCATVLLWGTKPVPKYFPDTVRNIDDLERRSTDYGCKSVASSITPIVDALNKSNRTHPFLVFVVFAVARPKPMPGSFSGDGRPDIEYIPYACILEKHEVLGGRKGAVKHFQRPKEVEPFGLHYDISRQVLQDTSGVSYPDDERRLTLIGCGSLGSKLAMHLGKSGFGDFDLIDEDRLSPHNLARMGIVNSRFGTGVPKTVAVKTELKMLGHNSITVSHSDVVFDLASADGMKVSEKSVLILDATASINVHNALCIGQFSREVRIAQASFMAGGRLGFVAIEGNKRGPDLEDLKSEFWRYWLTASKAEHEIWKSQKSAADRIRVGEGCDSMSTIMSDMAASLLTAGMAKDFSDLLRAKALHDQGRISFGLTSRDGRSVFWKDIALEPTTVVKADGGWEVRILPALAQLIERRSRKAGKLETGGYLVGRINPAIRRITLTSDVPPPPDSVHRADRFILGTQGARVALLRLHELSKGAFLAVGTWHSHPMGGGESHTDIDTLQDIARDFCGTPAVSLIWRPEGYHAVVEQIWDDTKATVDA